MRLARKDAQTHGPGACGAQNRVTRGRTDEPAIEWVNLLGRWWVRPIARDRHGRLIHVDIPSHHMLRLGRSPRRIRAHPGKSIAPTPDIAWDRAMRTPDVAHELTVHV